MSGVVFVVAGQVGLRVAYGVAVKRFGPIDPAGDRFRIGVQQEFGGIETMPGFRLIRPMNAVAIMLAWPSLRQIDMPDIIGAFLDHDPVRCFRGIGSVEEAEFHRRGIFRKEGEVHPFAVPCGAERVGMSGPDSHASIRLLVKNGLNGFALAVAPESVSYNEKDHRTQWAGADGDAVRHIVTEGSLE